MVVLDENVPESQRRLLRKWRIHFRAVGVNVGKAGTPDADLIPVLHRLARPTFFSLDSHFYRSDWMHSGYCLIWLDLQAEVAAEFIRRFLRYPAFNTHAKRMGLVARVHADGVQLWRRGKQNQQAIAWRGSERSTRKSF